MMLFAESDNVLIAQIAASIILAMITLAGTVFTGWMAFQVMKLQKTTDTVHALVNGAMGTQLKLNAVSLRRIADMSGDAKDIEAAQLAETALRRHQATEQKIENKAVANPVPKPPATLP